MSNNKSKSSSFFGTRYPIYIIYEVIQKKKRTCYYNPTFSEKYAYTLEEAKRLTGASDAVYANREPKHFRHWTCTKEVYLYNNVILCYVESDLPIYTSNINLEEIVSLKVNSSKNLNIKNLIKLENIKKSPEKIYLKAKNVEDAKKLAKSNYGVYLCRSGHTSRYEVFTDRDQKNKLCEINIYEINFPSNSFICYKPSNNVQQNISQRSNSEINNQENIPQRSNSEINYQQNIRQRSNSEINNQQNIPQRNNLPFSGGLKKKIHTGKRGGKYYIKNGKKVYI